MIDLSSVSGMALSLSDDGHLLLSDAFMPVSAVPRLISELGRVLAESPSRPDGPAYLMYRGVAPTTDAAALAARNARYDVTILSAGTLGREYVKTAGHYHPAAPSGVAYPEIYEVLHGHGAFLMQRADAGRIVDAVVVYASRGEKIMMPPGYGHITVNVGSEPLVIGNLVADDFESVYGEYADLRGGAYYLFQTPGGPEARPNPNYGAVPALRVAPPAVAPDLGLDARPLFTAWKQDPDRFVYLDHPETLPANLRP